MGKADFSGITKTNTMAISMKIIFKGKVNISGQMGECLKENGRMIKWRGLEPLLGLTGVNIAVSIKMG